MVNSISFFSRWPWNSTISVDVLPQNVEEPLKIRELKKLIAALKESVWNLKVDLIDPRDVRNEDSNILINKLAEEHGNFKNIGLLKEFYERAILEVLKECIKEPGIRRGVAKILKRMYFDSFANDQSILDLEKFLKAHMPMFRRMFKDTKNQKNLPEREVESIELEIQQLKALKINQQIEKLQNLLERDVFKFYKIQGVLDETTLRRLDDYLEYQRSQFQAYYISRLDFNLIKSHVTLIKRIVSLKNKIERQLASLKAQSKVNYVEDLESYNRNKNMLLSAYSLPLWNAVFERVVELICDSFDSNLQLRRKLTAIGFIRGWDIKHFLNYAKFNEFLNSYNSDKSIDNLVHYFLNNLSHQALAELSTTVKECSKDAQKRVLLNAFRKLNISFEDLDL